MGVKTSLKWSTIFGAEISMYAFYGEILRIKLSEKTIQSNSWKKSFTTGIWRGLHLTFYTNPTRQASAPGF